MDNDVNDNDDLDNDVNDNENVNDNEVNDKDVNINENDSLSEIFQDRINEDIMEDKHSSAMGESPPIVVGPTRMDIVELSSPLFINVNEASISPKANHIDEIEALLLTDDSVTSSVFSQEDQIPYNKQVGRPCENSPSLSSLSSKEIEPSIVSDASSSAYVKIMSSKPKPFSRPFHLL